jgi:hypothetical protein
MNDGVDTFRLRLQKELGLSIGPKDPLLAQWLSQRELLEENAAEHQRLLSEFEAAIGRSQTAWSEQAKGRAQQTLNAALLAARNSTASLLEEAAQVKRGGSAEGARTGGRPDGGIVSGQSPDRLVESGSGGCGLDGDSLRRFCARDSLNLQFHPPCGGRATLAVYGKWGVGCLCRKRELLTAGAPWKTPPRILAEVTFI